MKFTAHAKNWKPPEEPKSKQTTEFAIHGHTHVHTPPHLLKEVKPLQQGDVVIGLDYGEPNWQTDFVTKQYVEEQLTKFVGGPVMTPAQNIHPSDISITKALDALKHHGVYWKNLSVHHTPEGIDMEARISIFPKSKDALMELESWFIK